MSNSVLDLSREFAGRRVLVTGGSRGIGAAIAQRLLDGGASVVVVARNRHEQTPKGATFIKGDILTPEGCKKIVEESIKVLGGLDILINNAAAAKLVKSSSATVQPLRRSTSSRIHAGLLENSLARLVPSAA